MFMCMRTTMNLNDEIMRELKQLAARTGRTMTEIVEEALREKLRGEKIADPEYKLEWVTVSGRMLPGVDLADRDSLTELMEGRD
ncbi:MAG: ribbon-helix-helix protein, CopG family [Deltaproteobacteria bacterium]|nr:MAG: ribbon-helix-helix protein, CopG family [Deltaproteobacteria bacterium]